MAVNHFYNRIEVFKKSRKSETSTNWSATALVLDEAVKPVTTLGAGKVKDKIKLRYNNQNNRLYHTTYVGDGTQTYTWDWGTIPSDSFNSDDFTHFYVEVGGENRTVTTSGTDFTFTSYTPSVGETITVRFPIFERGDKIKVWYRKNESVPSSSNQNYFAIESFIESVNTSLDSGSRYVTVSGNGIIETIFNTLVFATTYDPDAVNTTEQPVNEVLSQDMVAQINTLNPGRKVIWAGDSVKSDGKAFPAVSYSTRYKRAIDVLEELSQNQYTQDGNYTYWLSSVGANYNLYWTKKNNVTSGLTTVTEGTEPNSLKVKYSAGDMVNAVIYHCGVDPKGYGMENLYYDLSSMSSNGTKWKYYTKTANIADNILKEEFDATPASWETNSADERIDRLPIFPFTFKVKTAAAINKNFGVDAKGVQISRVKSSDTCADIDAYMSAFRERAKYVGYLEADNYVKFHNFGKKTFVFDAPFTTIDAFSLNELITCDVPSAGFYDKILRVMQIQYEMPNIRVTLEEDEVTATL